MKTTVTLTALFFAAVALPISVYSNSKANSNHFERKKRHFNVLNKLTRHDCKLIFGEPKLSFPQTTGLGEAYVWNLGNDWQFIIYFETYGNYVHSFGIQPADLVPPDGPALASR